MLKEKYNLYKSTYKEYLIIIKSGNFYLCLNEDALILHQLFKYKIVESTNFIKVGFPLLNVTKITKGLDDKKINYIVVDEKIIEKQKYKDNNYSKYLLIYDTYQIYINRINKINEILKKNLCNKNIAKILNNIESELCTINY